MDAAPASTPAPATDARPPATPAGPVIRVVRFGVRDPTRRKAAILDEALRRQTTAYGRALAAVRPDALRWARAAAQRARPGLAPDRRATLDVAIAQARKAIALGAYRAARSAHSSSLMADAMSQDVLATLASWIGWRARFRAARANRIRRAEQARKDALADLPAAIARLQARRKGARITATHIRLSVDARVARARASRPPQYPTGPRLRPPRADRAALLDGLAVTTRKDAEDRLRDALAAEPRSGLHPLSWTRPADDKNGRGVSLFWDAGRLFAVLPGLLPKDARRQPGPIRRTPVRQVGTAEPAALRTSRGLVLPLCFGRAAWAYLDGWTPRTAKLVKTGERYELHVAFARTVTPALVDPARWIGIDRGVINMAAVADNRGRALWISGNPISALEQRLRIQREQQQRRGQARALRATRQHFRAAARNAVNRLAKHIVRLARRQRARISAENLASFAQGDARILSRAQYAQFLGAVDRGLERHGYQPHGKGGARVWLVWAGGTSQGCAVCGHTSPANRPQRDRFACAACGHTADADINAAVNIARRGHETWTAQQSRMGRAEGPRASARGVVARPAAADGGTAPRRWGELP